MASEKTSKPIIKEKEKEKKKDDTKKNEADLEKSSNETDDIEENAEYSDDDNRVMFFIGLTEAREIAKLVVDWITNDNMPDKKIVQEALSYCKNKETEHFRPYAVDIALFGRMVAKAPNLNIDASAQVAHAISTHRVDNEYDFFTAVDEYPSEGNKGAGMVDTMEYNSSTLYRYATVAGHVLYKQLADSPVITAKAITEFARAFISSMPIGKINSYANNTPPDGVVVSIRTDQPINFAGAFEKPVISQEGGYVSESIKRLVDYSKKTCSNYYGSAQKTWVIDESLTELGKVVELPELLNELSEELTEMFSCK